MNGNLESFRMAPVYWIKLPRIGTFDAKEQEW